MPYAAPVSDMRFVIDTVAAPLDGAAEPISPTRSSAKPRVSPPPNSTR